MNEERLSPARNTKAELAAGHNRHAGADKHKRQLGHRRARRATRALYLRASVPEPRPNKARWADA